MLPSAQSAERAAHPKTLMALGRRPAARLDCDLPSRDNPRSCHRHGQGERALRGTSADVQLVAPGQRSRHADIDRFRARTSGAGGPGHSEERAKG